MEYLVTGGAGFVGSHLVDKLARLGHSIIVLDDFSTGLRENLQQHSGNPKVRVFEGDIRDVDLVHQLVIQADRVFHLAAAVGVFNIVGHPLRSISTNILGSENVLSTCLRYEKPVLITSSSEIYGKNESHLLHENSDRIVGPPQKIRWSYSDSKAIDESIAITLHREAGLETRIVRLFNTVGPRQVGHHGMVIPRFVESALKGNPIAIYGSGRQTRCFGHVSDITDAILQVDEVKGAIGEPINIGVSQEISIVDLAAKVLELTNSTSPIEYTEYEQAYGAGFEDMSKRVPDTSKLVELTGWAPKYDINKIILDSIDYFSSNLVT